MNEKKIQNLIKIGEGNSVEFKECKTDINKDVYETVCAFLNRQGGEILLGVKDNGEITGIAENYIEKIKNDFATSVNNPQKLTPPFYLIAEEIKINNHSILYIFVPESSLVHRCNGKIFDRNNDGDFNITDNTNLVTALYIRKQTGYSENRIYHCVSINDLRSDLQCIIISTLTRGGYSGGPIVNRCGQVIGVLTEYLFKTICHLNDGINEGIGYTRGIPVQWLMDLRDGTI
jgi:ATP-dependent DNA helicase RecG